MQQLQLKPLDNNPFNPGEVVVVAGTNQIDSFTCGSMLMIESQVVPYVHHAAIALLSVTDVAQPGMFDASHFDQISNAVGTLTTKVAIGVVNNTDPNTIVECVEHVRSSFPTQTVYLVNLERSNGGFDVVEVLTDG